MRSRSTILPTIHVPTLIIHRKEDSTIDFDAGVLLAERIPHAKLVELPGADHLPWVGENPLRIIDEIEHFLTGTRSQTRDDRVLATLLFTDIVNSTALAGELGDDRWKKLLHAHDQAVRAELARFNGTEVKTTGDGFLATFDAPARAIRCALAINDAVQPLGVDIRAGLHTGEMHLVDGDVEGISVHIAARVAAVAKARDVVVSRTVKDLVAGSGISLEDYGTYTLKGVPEEWQLFRASA